MSYEETLICDSCSRVIDGGSRAMTTRTLIDQDGRAFRLGRRSGIEECPAEEAARAKRHLCGQCVDAEKFFDGEPVPTSPDSKGEAK